MTTKVEREYERIVVLVNYPDTGSRTFDIGPCAEDGKVWLWEGDDVLAGPFETKASGLAWMNKYMPVPNRVTRTRGFAWTKRVPGVQ